MAGTLEVCGGDSVCEGFPDVIAAGFSALLTNGDCSWDFDLACGPCLKRCRSRLPRGIVSASTRSNCGNSIGLVVERAWLRAQCRCESAQMIRYRPCGT